MPLQYLPTPFELPVSPGLPHWTGPPSVGPSVLASDVPLDPDDDDVPPLVPLDPELDPELPDVPLDAPEVPLEAPPGGSPVVLLLLHDVTDPTTAKAMPQTSVARKKGCRMGR